jgi:molybdopterin converting factor small subunit
MATDVTIKAFEPISSMLGTSEVILPCEGESDVRSIVKRLGEAYPAFAKYMSQAVNFDQYLLVVRGGKIEEADSIVHPGEVLTLVTPIAGG